MNQQKITPAIWFSAEGGNISKILEYYKQIFTEHFEAAAVINLGDTPSGHTEMCEMSLFGQKYSLMATEQPHNALNDSFAIIINCDDQNEIDRFWDYFTKEGKEYQCGWCSDKYGLRWQVIPKNMGELMQKPNSWKVMMGQKKIVIAEY